MINDQRTEMIAGLRALADFMEARPAIPVLADVTVYTFATRAADEVMKAEIDDYAAQFETPITFERGHYATSRNFGPVEWRAVAICSTAAPYRTQES
ncbi:hypothetical protein [Herbidospora cretacea]|uniref:hypothetical protein n=1 Tax=Herbidospora cretacea TaxID=28444 RepID=UPI000773189D|nr:hypothetical protein [Herbidospora cretacea]